MDYKKINLDVLTYQYLEKGYAYNGFKTINSLIQKSEVNYAPERHNKRKLIDLEVQERININSLFDFFSILEIGLIAEYIPNPLPQKLTNEILHILEYLSENNYFTKYYPQLLAQHLLDRIRNNKGKEYSKTNSSDASIIRFEKFLRLNQVIKQDTDIEQFLWFLDDGKTDGKSIADFWNVLAVKDIPKYIDDNLNKHPLDNAIWGFIKYIQFLSDYVDLLKNCREDTDLQSAFWLYQSYWFTNRRERLKDISRIGIQNIKQSVNDLHYDILVENKIIHFSSRDEFLEWKNDSIQLKEIEEKINYLLDYQKGNYKITQYEKSLHRTHCKRDSKTKNRSTACITLQDEVSNLHFFSGIEGKTNPPIYHISWKRSSKNLSQTTKIIVSSNHIKRYVLKVKGVKGKIKNRRFGSILQRNSKKRRDF